MARAVRVAIVLGWLGLMGALLRDRFVTTPPAPVNAARTEIRAGDEWLSVYREQQKIGYVHQSSSPADGGYNFQQHSVLHLVVMETPQTVRTIITGQTDAGYALRTFAFELSSSAGSLRVDGSVADNRLRLQLGTGGEENVQEIPLNGPIYLPATLRTFVAAGELRAGRQLQVQVFDPAAMRNETMQVTVEAKEPVPNGKPGQLAWRVSEEFRGIKTQAWIDDDGSVIREQGPMGLTLVRTDADEAMHANWGDGGALDLVQSVAVPVALPIEAARDAAVLRVRLRGIELDRIPSDARQQRDGDSWTITREPASTWQTYALPATDAGVQGELSSTALLQIDHPRVKAAAAEAVGDERDAVRAVNRILAWIGHAMTQQPTVSIPNALQVLNERRGDCNEHAVLFAALARAAGIPTRVVAGVVYQEGAFYYHAWNEVWLGRWITVDPTFAQFPADATHLKFVEGGPEEHFAILHLIGRLRIDVLASAGA